MQSLLYFASTPNLQNLCTVLVKLGSINSNDTNSAALKVQPQVIRCRELIFTDENVLASPSLQEKTHIYVIVQQSYWKTGQLQGLCKKLGLEFMKPVRVISTIFQSCFSYTLKAKLAPLWNKVGELYLHGRDFLVNSGPLPAVDLDLNVTETEICLALKGLGVNFPVSSLSSFRISPAVLAEFQRKTAETVPEFSIQEKWSHVLPSLKKGKVISVTHSIPQTSPFKKYKDIRRYWKNAYGYRLPEDDRGMYFYNIYFPMIGSNIFTYPSLCVRRMEPQIIPRIDPKSILQAFLRDIKVKMPSVCGLPLQFCDQAKYTKNVMAEATLQVHLLSGNTLTSEPPQTSKRLPTRSLNSIPKAVRPSYRVGQLTEPIPAVERLDTTMHPQSKSVLPNPPTTNCTFHFNENSQASCSAFRVPFSFQDELQDKSDVDSAAQRGMNSSRRVLFQPRDISTSVQHIQQPIYPIVPGPKIVPTFKPTKKKSLLASKKFSSTKASHQTKHVESVRKVQDFDSARSTTLIQRVPTRGQPVDSNKTLAATAICNSSASMYVASCTPRCAASSGPECVVSYAPSTFTASRGVTGLQNCSSTGHNPFRMSQTKVSASRNDIAFQQNIAEVGSSAMMIPVSAGNPEGSFPALQQQGALQVPEINSSHPQKRAQEVCNSNQAVKRAKTGPTPIQPNVELMAVNDQLHKVNAVTLSTWLKGKNIYVKSREKKADLIQKVLDFITAQKSEN